MATVLRVAVVAVVAALNALKGKTITAARLGAVAHTSILVVSVAIVTGFKAGLPDGEIAATETIVAGGFSTGGKACVEIVVVPVVTGFPGLHHAIATTSRTLADELGQGRRGTG